MTAARRTLSVDELTGSPSVGPQVPGIPYLPPLPADLSRRAARTVAANARDTADAVVLLAMLGLTA